MAAEHLLARLTAKGLQITGMGFGGIALISETDIAAALAGLDDHVYWLARAKYCRDTANEKQVWVYMQRQIEKKDKLTPDQARAAALTALYPVTVGIKCRVCQGTGFYRYKSCKACDGSGRGIIQDHYKASMMQVSKSTYSRRFKEICERWESEANIWDDTAIRHLYRQFRD